jgi:hypothetical protein
MLTDYPPRLQTFRSSLIAEIPKVPNSRPTIDHMHTLSTRQLILIYVTWKMRLVRAVPRKLRIWSGGVDPVFLESMRTEIEPLAGKVERGHDLRAHLSSLVNTLGFAMPNVPAEKRRNVRDAVLAKTGLHHFHVGPVNAANPRGRSGRLVFAEVTDDEFRIIAISGHNAFKIGSEEWTRLFGISRTYIQSQVPGGGPHMAHPVMSNGDSMALFTYAMHCEELMMRVDSQLDDPAFADELYSLRRVADGRDLQRPRKATFRWCFSACDLGVAETKSEVFFPIYFSPR